VKEKRKEEEKNENKDKISVDYRRVSTCKITKYELRLISKPLWCAGRCAADRTYETQHRPHRSNAKTSEAGATRQSALLHQMRVYERQTAARTAINYTW
jgi:hypothetical protein